MSRRQTADEQKVVAPPADSDTNRPAGVRTRTVGGLPISATWDGHVGDWDKWRFWEMGTLGPMGIGPLKKMGTRKSGHKSKWALGANMHQGK